MPTGFPRYACLRGSSPTSTRRLAYPAPPLTSTFRPHIYTPTEIQALLKEAARLTPAGSLRPLTFITLIGLLYCTGLPVSEALVQIWDDLNL